MKLSVDEAKVTGLQQVLILKFAFGLEKFPGFLRSRPLEADL